MKKLLRAGLGLATVALGAEATQAQSAESWATGGVVVSFEGGASYLSLPRMRYSSTSDGLGAVTTGKETNHDGQLRGARVGGAFSTSLGTWGALPVSGTLRWFYAGLASTDRNQCDGTPFASGPRCNWGNIADDPALPDKQPLGSDDRAYYATERKAANWGIALETAIGRPLEAVKSAAGFQPRVGIDYRRIDQRTTLQGIDVDFPDTSVDLRERLDTQYVGAYVGLTSRYPLGNDLSFGTAGQIGVYLAHASYRGRYATTFVSEDPFNASGSLNLSRDRVAAVAALQLDLTKRFETFTMAAFANVEWYSWAPEMKYDDDDVSPFADRRGPVKDTAIGNGDAWGVTAGVRLTVPLGNQGAK